MIDMSILKKVLDVKKGDIDIAGGIRLKVSPVSELPLDALLKDGTLPAEEVLKLVDGSKSEIKQYQREEVDNYTNNGVMWMVLNAHSLEKMGREAKKFAATMNWSVTVKKYLSYYQF